LSYQMWSRSLAILD
jgi:hypothetical protein